MKPPSENFFDIERALLRDYDIRSLHFTCEVPYIFTPDVFGQFLAQIMYSCSESDSDDCLIFDTDSSDTSDIDIASVHNWCKLDNKSPLVVHQYFLLRKHQALNIF